MEKIFLGLECEINSFIENFKREQILTNLKPELVEKNEPPIIISKRKIKIKSCGVFSNDTPTFDTLLEIAKNKQLKSKFLSVNIKNIA